VPAALIATIFAARTTWALPDLEPELYGATFAADQTVGTGDVAEGCAGGTTGRLLLRFGVRFHNTGTDPLVIGNPGCPVCAANPGAICEDPRFICSPADGHNHPHFIGFANYELRDFEGNLLRQGGKKSFCVRDNRCDSGTPVFDCNNQGISPGCVDDYDPSLGCQYIDVTDVPNVTSLALRLRATLDPNDQLPDANRSNNTAELDLPGCGDGTVQTGEECDGAATPAGRCCDADCQLAPPGTSCGPTTGPCGGPDAPFPDGTSCGPGAPPCMVQVCRSGVCASETGSGGCLIGATCFPPGTPDPVDACQRCDPSQRTDTWSRNVDPDLPGLQCEASRLTRALVGNTCRARVAARLQRPLLRIHETLDRLDGASNAVTVRMDRRLARAVARLVRAERRAARTGCDLGTFSQELDVLIGEFDTYRALQARSR